jgi:hypothetical protein
MFASPEKTLERPQQRECLRKVNDMSIDYGKFNAYGLTGIPGYDWKKIERVVNVGGVPILLSNGLKARLYRLSSPHMRDVEKACKHIHGSRRGGLHLAPYYYYALSVTVEREKICFVFYEEQWIQDLVWYLQQNDFSAHLYPLITACVYNTTAYFRNHPVGAALFRAVQQKQKPSIAALLNLENEMNRQ